MSRFSPNSHDSTHSVPVNGHRAFWWGTFFLLLSGLVATVSAQEEDAVAQSAIDAMPELLLEADEQNAPSGPTGVVHKASYRVELKAETVTIKGTLELEAFPTPGTFPLQSGWIVVPLGDAGLSITETNFGKAKLNYGGDGFEVLLPESGTYQLGFVAQAPVKSAGDSKTLLFDLIPGAVSKVEAVFPGQGWHFDWSKPLAYERIPEGPDTRLEFYFSGSDPFELTWQQEENVRPVVHAESKLKSHIAGEMIETQVQIYYQVERGPVDTFEMLVPFPHQVLEVKNEGVQWQVVPEGAARKLVVKPEEGVTDRFELEFVLGSGIESYPAEIELSELSLLQVDRHIGNLSVTASSKLEAKVERTAGLSSVESEPVDMNGAHLVGDFRFLSTPYSLGLSLDEAKPLLQATSATLVHVDPAVATMTSDFSYDIKRVPAETLGITLPEGYSKIDVEGELVEAFEVEGRSLTVNLAGPQSGDVDFRITASKARSAAEQLVLMPVFEVPEVKNYRGTVGLSTRGNLRASLQSPGSMTSSPEETDAEFLFVTAAKDQPAEITIREIEPKISAEVTTKVDLRNSAVLYNWWIDFSIQDASTDTLYLEVPSVISDKLATTNADYQMILKGADGVGPPREGMVWWVIKLNQAIKGEYQLPLSMVVTDPGFEVGESVKISVPVLQPSAASVKGQLAVVKTKDLELSEKAGGGMEAISPREVPLELAGSDAHSAYEYFKPGVSLNLTVSRSQLVEVADLSVEYADATTVVSSEGGLKTEIVYWIRSIGQNSLRVQLPDRARMISQSYVDGEEEPVRMVEGSYVIPLRSSDSKEAFPVRIAYEVPSPDGASGLPEWRTVLPMAELPGVEVVQSRLRLFLPEDYRYNRVESAMVQAGEESRWKDVRYQLVSLIPSIESRIAEEEIVGWHAPPEAKDGVESPLAEEGVVLELRRLDAPGEVLIGYGRKARANFLDVILGLLAFCVGGWLTRSSMWSKFIYFVFVGLLSLFLASSSSPHFAQVFGSVFLGVTAAGIVWVIAGIWEMLRQPEPQTIVIKSKAEVDAANQVSLKGVRESVAEKLASTSPEEAEKPKKQRTRSRDRVAKTFKRRSDRVLNGRTSLASL